MPSAPQVVSTSILFDYLLTDAGVAIPNARVTVVLNSSKPTTSITPLTVVALTQQYVITDANGYWQFALIPNTNLSPANTTYTVSTPDSSYDVTLGAVGPYQSTAAGTIVNVPTALVPASQPTVPFLNVTAGEPGIDTATAGALILGDNNATSIELGAALSTPGGGNVALQSLTVLPSGPYTPTAPAGGGRFAGTVPAGSTTPLVQEGSAPFDGTTLGFFTGSASGTIQGINAPSGFGGNLVDWQVAGVSVFKISNTGTGMVVTSPFFLQTSMTLTNGSILFATNDAYIQFQNNSHHIFLQAGGPRPVQLAGDSTLTFPDLNLGGVGPSSGFLLAVKGGTALANHIPVYLDQYGSVGDSGYTYTDPSVTTLTTSGQITLGTNMAFTAANPSFIGPSGTLFFANHANNANNMQIEDTGRVTILRESLRILGDHGSGSAGSLSLTNTVGIGNGANTNMQSPILGTGSGPTSAVLVTDWLKVWDGTVARWIPAFT